MAPSGLLQRAYRESGLASVRAAGRDAWLIILARSARMFAYGGAGGVVLALFLAELGTPDARIGLFMTLSLLGDVLLSLALSLVADGGRRGRRRRCLMLGSALMVAAGVVFATCENFWLLLVAAVVGVISTVGSDMGPFRAVEESILADLAAPAARAEVLGWYNCLAVLALSAGSEAAGRLIEVLRGRGSLLMAYHACFWAYTGMGVVVMVACLLLSENCELKKTDEKTSEIPTESDRLLGGGGGGDSSTDNDSGSDTAGTDDEADHGSRRGTARSLASVSTTCASTTSPSSSSSPSSPSRSPAATKQRKSHSGNNVVAKISGETLSILAALWPILMIDSFADGMSNVSLTTYFLDLKFGRKDGSLGGGLSKSAIADAVSAAYFLAAASCVLAGPLSRRIGLVNTMVFTHVPSSAAVLLFPLPRTAAPTVGLLLVRMWLNNMDQAPRAALIAAVVRPSERTAVMGLTSMLRTLAAAAGPMATGLLAGRGWFWVAFVVAGALRLAYDLGLFVMFVNITLHRHEQPAAAAVVGAGETAAGEAARRDGWEGRAPGDDEERGRTASRD